MNGFLECPVFFMQVAVSAVGLGLSCAMLAQGRDAGVYLPVLTSIVAYWLPAPRRPVAPPSPERASSQASVGMPQQQLAQYDSGTTPCLPTT